jgi:hypothetical protein
MSMFVSPSAANGDTIKPADVEGHLLVVEPIEYIASMATSFGDTDAVRINVHDINAQATYESVLWFSGGLVGSLKGRVGQKVLGTMGKGTAKPGMSAPWILQDASGNDKAVAAATAYLTGQVAAQLTEPAAPAPSAKPTMSALDAALANLEASAIH